VEKRFPTQIEYTLSEILEPRRMSDFEIFEVWNIASTLVVKHL
jgi:hypothetical protein